MRHFTQQELCHTDNEDPAIRAQQANPAGWVLTNLDRLVDEVLDYFRDGVGHLHTNSGWRCAALNSAQPLAAATSYHMLGLAADLVPLDMSAKQAMQWLVASGLPFDKAIYEKHRGVWIHVQVPKAGALPRRQAIMMLGPVWVNGKLEPKYEPWDPDDARLK